MNDKPIQVKPGMYALFFENLKVIANVHGYNLVLHGSMNRDMDLIAIPWVDDPKPELEMIQAFEKYLTGMYSEQKEHYCFSVLPGGRNSYVININRGNKRGEWFRYFGGDEQYYLDISITPLIINKLVAQRSQLTAQS